MTVKVLVVDDHPMMRGALRTALEILTEDVVVVLAGSLQDAFRQLATQPQPDLVLLDLVMPGMSGREVFHALQALEPGLRVLLVSGYSEGDDVQDLLEAGALGLLGKPFRLAKLKERIQELLQLA